MSTHNICFYGELSKITFQLSTNTHLICSTGIMSIICVLLLQWATTTNNDHNQRISWYDWKAVKSHIKHSINKEAMSWENFPWELFDQVWLKPAWSAMEASKSWNLGYHNYRCYSTWAANNKGTDQTVWIHRPICAFFDHISLKQVLSWLP